MKNLKGSMTVEAAYVVPIVLMVFVMIVYSTFYFHDKNIIKGTLCEVEAIIGQRERIEETADHGSIYFEERLGDKLILLTDYTFESEAVGDEVILYVRASHGVMSTSAQGIARATRPEKHIRMMRNVTR